MEWSDEGIVLSVRPWGESAAVVSLLARENGRHAGLVKGGAGRRGRAALQPGNRLTVTWKARLAEQLGVFAWDAAEPFGTRWLDDAARLAGVASACALAEATLPERQVNAAAYEGLLAFLASLAAEDWPSRYVLWELDLLAVLGFGLDLSRCAATGANDGLIYVSPRSGQAVSAAAGEPYRDRLLALPAFLKEGVPGTAEEVGAGLKLTGYFLERHVLAPQARKLPPARSRLVARLQP